PSAASAPAKEDGVYTISFKGNSYVVQVSAGGDITSMQSASAQSASGVPAAAHAAAPVGDAEDVNAPLSGTIWKVLVSPNQQINEGDTLVVLEAMKMETEIKAARSGTVVNVSVKEGDSVTVGQALLSLA
ncbi:MAG: biotin/lipoyl-containing protein, partial [Gammaproteobacteria bacterium]